MDIEELKALLGDNGYEGTVVFTDYVDAFLGVDDIGRACYDYERMVQWLMDRDGLIDACANLKAQNDKLSEELSCVTAELIAMRHERDEWMKAAEDAGKQIEELRERHERPTCGLMNGRERETTVQ